MRIIRGIEALYAAQLYTLVATNGHMIERDSTLVYIPEPISNSLQYGVLQNLDCHGLKTPETCIDNKCAWCACAAVPSSCYTKDEAAQLPSAIFNCSIAKESLESLIV